MRVVLAEDLYLLRTGLETAARRVRVRGHRVRRQRPGAAARPGGQAAGCRGGRHPAAADVHRRGAEGRHDGPPGGAGPAGPAAVRARRAAVRAGAARRPGWARSATCSRTGCSTTTSSRTRCAPSRAAARSWTPRWSPSCWAGAPATSRSRRLSGREREVLALMAEGRSNSAIAQRLSRLGQGGRQALHLDLRQAGPRAVRRRQPPGPGGPRLPEHLSRYRLRSAPLPGSIVVVHRGNSGSRVPRHIPYRRPREAKPCPRSRSKCSTARLSGVSAR